MNKGTAAIGLTFRNQPLLFITSHLAARASQGRLRQRNYQAKLTLKRLGIGRIPNVDVTRQYSTFWFGDFNYRVKSRNKYWPNEELHRDDVIEIIKSDVGQVTCDALCKMWASPYLYMCVWMYICISDACLFMLDLL